MQSHRLIVCAFLSLIVVQGCYEYVPVESPSPPVGKLVEVKISDPGRVGLAPRFGVGLDRVEGQLVSERDSEMTLKVLSVTNLDGEHTRWSGETVNLDRGFVRSVKSRRLSPVRTTLFAAVGAGVLYAVAGRALIGGGKDPADPDPGNPPLSRRIPIGVRVRINP